MDQEYNNDVYLEPTVELDDSAAIGQQQEIKVQICTTGC